MVNNHFPDEGEETAETEFSKDGDEDVGVPIGGEVQDSGKDDQPREIDDTGSAVGNEGIQEDVQMVDVEAHAEAANAENQAKEESDRGPFL